MESESYSSVAAKNSETLPSQHLDARLPPVARKTTVRFDFEVMPDKKEFLAAVVDVVEPEFVKCIQTLPGGRVDLTLRHDECVLDILNSGIQLNGSIVKPRALGFRTTYVYIQYLPTELSSTPVGDFMERFGRVIEVKRQLYEGTQIETGTRIAVLEVREHIPSFLYIGGYRAKLWHKGQIQTCAVCGEMSHFAKDCPKRRERQERVDSTEAQPTTTSAPEIAEASPEQAEQVQPTDETKEQHEEKPTTEIDPDLLPSYESCSEGSGHESTDSSDDTDLEQDNFPPPTKASQASEHTEENLPHDVVVDTDLERRPVKRSLTLSPAKTKPKRQKPKNRRK